jgi:hypothetical protein
MTLLYRSILLAALVAPALALSESPPLPARLSDTGLYVDGQPGRVRVDIERYSPQYPLWSDGARKTRWLSLPPGTAIDARDPDAWVFPPGTRLWKAFAHDERAVETRYIERLADGSWRFATYLWNADGSDAELAPADGAVLEVAAAPGGRYVVPARDDCRACHAGAAVPVLGVGALQLSADRDPHAPHAEPRHDDDADLQRLVARGWLRDLPAAVLATPPRIAARTADERAVLGYLHGNCAHCHHAGDAAVPVDLTLQQRVVASDEAADATLRSMIDARARFRPHGRSTQPLLVAPGNSAVSLLPLRMRSRNPLLQMPPLGTQRADHAALALINRWIDSLPPPQE